MSGKKKKIVQPAAEEKPSEDSSPILPQEPSQEATAPTMPFDLSKVDPKKIEIAEEMGIPIKQLIGWAASVEMRFGAIEKSLVDAPQKVVEALKAEALKRQTEIAQQMQQNPQQAGTGGGLAQLAPLINLLGSGGGSSEFDEEMKSLSKDLLRAQIVKIKGDVGFSEAIQNAIVAKISAKAVAEIIG